MKPDVQGLTTRSSESSTMKPLQPSCPQDGIPPSSQQALTQLASFISCPIDELSS